MIFIIYFKTMKKNKVIYFIKRNKVKNSHLMKIAFESKPDLKYSSSNILEIIIKNYYS